MLHYQILGPSDKPSLVFLHGFLGSCGDWLHIVEHLSAEYRCVMIDLPGHGLSADYSQDEAWTISFVANEIVRILQYDRTVSTHLIGYSMGGRLALYLLSRYPQYFVSGILESASPGLQDRTERQERVAADAVLAKEMRQSEATDFVHSWYQKPLWDSLRMSPNYHELIQRRGQTNPDLQKPAKMLIDMGTGAQPSLWEELPELKIPVFLIVGEKDAKFTAIGEAMLAASLQFSRFVVPDCGHNVHIESPRVYTTQLREWLSSRC